MTGDDSDIVTLGPAEARCALAPLGKNQKWVEGESGRCHVTVSRYLRGRDVWPDCRDDISRVLVAALRKAGHWQDDKGLVLSQQVSR